MTNTLKVSEIRSKIKNLLNVGFISLLKYVNKLLAVQFRRKKSEIVREILPLETVKATYYCPRKMRTFVHPNKQYQDMPYHILWTEKNDLRRLIPTYRSTLNPVMPACNVQQTSSIKFSTYLTKNSILSSKFWYTYKETEQTKKGLKTCIIGCRFVHSFCFRHRALIQHVCFKPEIESKAL